jgi:hypothetical protein
MATARKFSAEEQRKLLAELEVPFDPAMVKWKVVRRAHSGRRGAVLPFADPRAYTDRLNQVLTPAGWGRTYALSTLSNLTRRLWDGKSISTGKVLVTSTVSIHRLGSHLRKTLATEALRLGLSDIDLSALERAEPRHLTQLASREAYLLNLAGIYYRSRYGHSLENWAIFEPFPLSNAQSTALSANDPDFLAALKLHRIALSLGA